VAQLRFNLLAAAFEYMHGDVGVVAVFEGDGGIAYLCEFVGGQKSHAVDHYKICHGYILSPNGGDSRGGMAFEVRAQLH
jgi:hypothetical protein